ncbi:hypothetical protein I350_08239 [Cryptococcus amylolentus CBS 6273]|uniref:Glycosyl hydrolase family 32 N-terminal domain-containing protein n=1 Tax=Cryptococcus amylolentus CBS 6273 TaxID=1296118 RepID=A0A1E3J5T7_9TREE|nr:hypothetical protein I350_08239 [Cryptococcus amylolentus CBS 6273]
MVSLIPIAVLGIAYALGGFAQSSTSASSPAPTGVAPEGDYSGSYRPRIHFSPPQGFMNDPNGLFQDPNGTWHLYYQYNPTDTVAGNQHWGHATSSDLYHWTNQPIALFPPNSTSGVFSGSAVLDPDNTSGFFPNQTDGVVAIYTLNTEYAQVQQIAYSFDGGYTFEEYAGNPVIDIGSLQFRDPKVVWYEDHWAMVIAYSADYVIGVYTSPDLREWTHASNISHIGLLGVQYECPNLVSLPIANSSETAWVLTISINPGAPLGGSVTEYFPGSFNGTHFTPIDGATRLSNFAKDDYAGQFFYNTPISIGWASNWQYTNVVPSGEEEGWRSAMTLPRTNYLANATSAGWDLVQEVVDLSPVLGDELASGSLGNGTTTVNFSTGVYLDVNFTIPDGVSASAAINFTVSTNTTGEKVTGGYFPESKVTWLDRGKTEFENVFFTDKFSVAQYYLAKRLQLIIDKSVIEIYVDSGVLVGTITAFPSEPFSALDLQGLGLPAGADVEYVVWELEDMWA